MGSGELVKSEETKLAKSEERRQIAERLLTTVNAQRPTKAQLAELREQMKLAPAIAQELGDLSLQLRQRLIDDIAAAPGLRMVVQEQVRQMANALAAEGASPLERLLIDQILIAWLRWQHAEWAMTSAYKEGISFARANYLERRLTATQGRYLRTVESLARVRRLLSRTQTQINIAQQQIVQNS